MEKPPYFDVPPAGRMISRGLRKRCPRCGAGNLFESRFTMRERCGRCVLKLEREEAHFVGAMAINLVVTEILFGIMLISWAILAWPKPPWAAMTITGVGMNIVVPILFFPVSKSLWTAIDLVMHRFDPIDRTTIELP
jgi:uncharacterized protein (DUF983 family)